jgi:hypothetical protein
MDFKQTRAQDYEAIKVSGFDDCVLVLHLGHHILEVMLKALS